MESLVQRSGKSGSSYWRPKLNDSEWELLNRSLTKEISESTNFLDEATKWLYAKEKGVEVFALYGIGDGTVPTPLYVSRGKKASAENVALKEYLGVIADDYSGKTFTGWLDAISAATREYYADYDAHGHRRKALGLDSILSKHPASLRAGNIGGSAENSEDITQKSTARSDADYITYNRRAIISGQTLNKWLFDYAWVYAWRNSSKSKRREV